MKKIYPRVSLVIRAITFQFSIKFFNKLNAKDRWGLIGKEHLYLNVFTTNFVSNFKLLIEFNENETFLTTGKPLP